MAAHGTAHDSDRPKKSGVIGLILTALVCLMLIPQIAFSLVYDTGWENDPTTAIGTGRLSRQLAQIERWLAMRQISMEGDRHAPIRWFGHILMTPVHWIVSFTNYWFAAYMTSLLIVIVWLMLSGLYFALVAATRKSITRRWKKLPGIIATICALAVSLLIESIVVGLIIGVVELLS